MAHSTCGFKIGLLGVQAPAKKPRFAPSESIEASVKSTVDLVVESRDRWEHHRLQSCTILNKFQRIALVKANLEASEQREAEQSLFERVREGKV